MLASPVVGHGTPTHVVCALPLSQRHAQHAASRAAPQDWSVTKLLIVGLGGFIGAIARYGLSGLVQRAFKGPFPLGTLVVNVTGCLVIGAAMCLVEQRQFFSPNARLLLIIGFLGSLTTFSTVGYETFAFLRDRQFVLVLANVATNLLIGVGAVTLGWISVKALGI